MNGTASALDPPGQRGRQRQHDDERQQRDRGRRLRVPLAREQRGSRGRAARRRRAPAPARRAACARPYHRPMHLTEAVLAPLRERYGEPRPLRWEGEVSAEEFTLAGGSPERRHDVTFFVFDPGGRLALIQKPSYPEGVWRPPGGGVQPGERFETGVQREAMEELGIRIELERFLVSTEATFRCADGVIDWRTHVFSARTDEEELAADRHARDQRRALGHERGAGRPDPRAPARDRPRALALPGRAARRRARPARAARVAPGSAGPSQSGCTSPGSSSGGSSSITAVIPTRSAPASSSLAPSPTNIASSAGTSELLEREPVDPRVGLAQADRRREDLRVEEPVELRSPPRAAATSSLQTVISPVLRPRSRSSAIVSAAPGTGTRPCRVTAPPQLEHVAPRPPARGRSARARRRSARSRARGRARRTSARRTPPG